MGNVNSRAAQEQRFVERRHAQPVSAGALEHACHRNEAMPVGVGLDHGIDRNAWPTRSRTTREIAGQCGLVDLEPHAARQRTEGRPRSSRLSIEVPREAPC